ncbi:ferric/cupric-chelate reductase [Nowakowskiella sp. JEL0078]|nr:ferric/cupric-chelate reductase [Nowakowskiella sp. JEL0078]
MVSYKPSDVALGLLSLAIFPASFIVVFYMEVDKRWCFADFCVESMNAGMNRADPARHLLIVFYAFLALTAAFAFTAKRNVFFSRVLSYKLFSGSSISLGEVSWFVFALLISNIVMPAVIWKSSFQMWIDMVSPRAGPSKGIPPAHWPWIRLVYETLITTTGDSLAVVWGLSLLASIKNSVLLSFLDLPFTSTLRVHNWLGYTSFWLTVIHLLATMLSYSLDVTPLYTLFFTVPANSPWGANHYLYITGFLSFFVLTFVVILSLPIVRRNFYNTFFYSHFFIFVSILFGYFHASLTVWFLIPGFCLYAIDGIIRVYARFVVEKVTSVIHEESGYCTITVKTNRASLVKPGQFMRVNFPNVSKLEYHAWSVAGVDQDVLTFVFATASNNEKEWTNKLVKILKSEPNQPVTLQGPYGIPNQLGLNAPNYDVLVFYVGGTGVAPAFSVINSTLRHLKEKASFVNNEKPSFGNDEKTSPLVNTDNHQKVFLFWTSAAENIEKHSLIQDWTTEPHSPVVVRFFDTSDPRTDSPKTNSVSRNRPHLRALLNEYVVPLASDFTNLKVGIFICGPEGFTKDGLLSIERFQKNNAGVHITTEVESFAL